VIRAVDATAIVLAPRKPTSASFATKQDENGEIELGARVSYLFKDDEHWDARFPRDDSHQSISLLHHIVQLLLKTSSVIFAERTL
jgi:hypothetical protein